ncbi:MAG: hypothetical protein CVU42_11765 [Chloroflexi bacterium HGW-Chloroflexi-4]|nr:MAG: hypothetical protein CVU42_11765 [Chloroflexi bacterium HGW-Chloroflexi-4]
MKRNRVINLVEALRGNNEKISIMFGLLAVGFLALSIYIFGTQAKLSWLTFPSYLISTLMCLYTGCRIAEKNFWFVRLFMFLNGIQELLTLVGWIWVLYLAQENPEGKYSELANLPFLNLISFFLIIFLTTFASLIISLIGMNRKIQK